MVKTEKKERVGNRIVIFNGDNGVIDYQRIIFLFMAREWKGGGISFMVKCENDRKQTSSVKKI